jgi:hypothetical protein
MTTKVIVAAMALGLTTLILAGQAPPTAAPIQGKSQPVKDAVKTVVIEDQLTNADPFDKVRKGCNFKIHVIKMVPGRQYEIRMDSSEFDSYLRLEDSTGKQLAEDDDSGGNLNARIVFTPTKADTYRIITTTFSSGMSGLYTLTIRPSGAPAESVVLKISPRLVNTDPADKVKQGSYHQVHPVRLRAGKAYKVEMSSSQVNPCLRVEDIGEKVLATGDRPGGGAGSATILFRPTRTGTYRVIATTGNPNQEGNYSLRVTEQ